MPQVVLVLPERPLRRLWEHAFGAAGWRTHRADTVIDALAVAFNCEANAVVASLFDRAGNPIGAGLVREFSADPALARTSRYLLAPPGMCPHQDEATVLFEQPCDPFWLIDHADRRLGNLTPAGLGHRPLSEHDLDEAVHHWWWDVAALHLVRDALTCRRTLGDGLAFVEAVGERLGRRIDAEVRFVAPGDPRPDGDEAGCSAGGAPHARPFVVALGEPSVRAGWWRVVPPGEGLTSAHLECIGTVAAAVGALLVGQPTDQRARK